MTEPLKTTDVPIASLYGPTTYVSNVGRFARGLIAVCLLALVVVSLVLIGSGVRKNNQINDLHQHGVAVTAKVSGCLGLLGGSGSQSVGYSCDGAYTLDGKHHTQTLPGTSFRSVGSPVRIVAVPSDPGLITLARMLPTQHTSNRVFWLPAVFLVVALVGGLLLLLDYRRRHGSGADRSQPAARA